MLEAAEASQLCSDSIVAPEVARSCSCFRKADTFSPEWWCGGAHPFLPLVVLRKASCLVVNACCCWAQCASASASSPWCSGDREPAPTSRHPTAGTLLAFVVCSQNFPRAAAAVKIAAAVSLFLLLWFGMAKGPLPPGEGRLRAGCLSDEAMCCQIYGLDVQTNSCAV